MAKKHNCYRCTHRGTIPGSAHSSCEVLSTLSTTEMAELRESGKGPIVKVNPHGARNGWASWPINFDPVWIDKCKVFEDKDNLVTKKEHEK